MQTGAGAVGVLADRAVADDPRGDFGLTRRSLQVTPRAGRAGFPPPAGMVRCVPGVWRAGVLLLFLTGAAAAPAALRGQTPPRVIPDAPVCGGCSIERFLIATVHDADYAEGAIGETAGIHVNRDGTFLVQAGFGVWDELYWVGRDGAIVRRIGRLGSGPGEFRIPMFVMETATEYLVADPVLGRITHLDRNGLDFRTTTPIPGTLTGVVPVVWPDGTYLFWGSVGIAGAADHGFHVVSPDGRVRHSFGPSSRGEETPLLARSGEHAFWALYRDYRIDRWSRDGRLLASFQRHPDWFRPLDRSTAKPGERFSMRNGLYEDPDGRLWVHFRIGTWLGQLFDGAPAANDSVIEVIDPVAGRVFATSRARGIRAHATGGHGLHLSVRREAPSGLTVFDVWGTRLVEPAARR
jgi:hypothetical protein